MSPRRMFLLFMVVTIAVAFWQWLLIPRPRGQVFRMLGIITGLALALEIAGFTAVPLAVNITWAYNLFVLVESLLLLKMFGVMRPQWRPALGAGALVVLAAFGLNYAMERRVDFLLTEAVLVNALVLSLFILAMLWDLAQTSEEPLQRSPEFWMLLGLLIYFSGMIPLVGMLRYLYYDAREMSASLNKIILTVASIRYLLTALACRMAARRPPGILYG